MIQITKTSFSILRKLIKAALIFLLIVSTTKDSKAQQQQNNNKQYPLIYIEADPFAYINKGYSIHLGYENWAMRFDLTKVKVDFPISFEEAFYNSTAFDLRTNIHGIKVDYIGNRKNWTKNAFIGLDVNHQTLNFVHRESYQQKNLNAFYVGVRAGYKINLFKGFYITPWAALWKNVASIQSYSIGDDIVTTNEWDWITTLHLGYAVKIK